MAVRVCVVGSVNADLTYTVVKLPNPGQTVLASSLTSSPGGKGGNQAVAAARAGAAVQLVAALGTDAAAERLRTHLAANGVGLAGVTNVPGPSGSAAIIVDSAAQNCIVAAPGANMHLSLSSAAIRSVVADSDVVLIQLEIPVGTATTAARVGRDGGALVIVNASPAARPDNVAVLAELADVVVVNETEAHDWLTDDPPRASQLVITQGAGGASLIADGVQSRVASPAVEPVDTTGAGDVFAGVLATHWLDGAEVALRRACAAGALATLVHGAGDCAPNPEAVDDILETLETR
ncbi:MAG: ribokinase [Actinomycetia bacterium]|nr:ribokinase [Actinomycetes bacterium]